jgi:hypothetical protein
MKLDRSHVVLAAAVGFAVLAGIEARHAGERGTVPVAEARPAITPIAPLPPVAAAPPEPLARELPGLVIEGRITNPGGGPIPGARVSVPGDRGPAGTSDATGSYSIRVETGEGDAPALRFSAAGYQDEVVALQITEDDDRLWLDVRLEPAPGAVVSGTLRSERGAPVGGEAVHLVSKATGDRYASVSDANGRFRLPGVAPETAYYLYVRPHQAYADYQTSVEVDADGASLDISLRELSTTRLTGRLVDPRGRPIRDLAFAVVSGQALGQEIRARSGADGSFSLEDVPTGHLSLLARAPELLAIGDILLAPGSDAYVTVRVDWGEETLSGRIVGEDGRPLGGAEVGLSWSHVDPETKGRSRRTAVTDTAGVFRFRRLASGVHRLDVSAPGYRTVEVDYEVASDAPGVEVELTPARGAG